MGQGNGMEEGRGQVWGTARDAVWSEQTEQEHVERTVVDEAGTVEGHAVRALKYRADESVLKKRDRGVTGGFRVGDGR